MMDQEKKGKKQQKDEGPKRKLWYAALTALLSVLLMALYYFSLNFSFFPFVMWGYMAALAALTLGYIIYNRAMSRNGVTVEMLPDEWDEEKKTEFVEDGKRRLRRSKWMLMLIIAFVITFAVEAIMLFVFPLVEGMF